MGEIKALLVKPCWTYKDVMLYLTVGKTKAYQIIERCKKRYGGTIPEMPDRVSRDSVLAYAKTTIEKEIKISKGL